MFLLKLAEDLNELVEGLILSALFNMKRQRKYVKGIPVNRVVVLLHIEKESEFVGNVVVGLHLAVDSPLVRQVSLRGRLAFFSDA